MKKLTEVATLSRYLKPSPVAMFNVPREERSEYFYHRKQQFGLVIGLNIKDTDWEHVLFAIEEPKGRCPSYKEMVRIKEMFWNKDEITFQVYPAKRDYVNMYPNFLHLWRFRDIKKANENRLMQKIHDTLQEASSTSNGKKGHFVLQDDLCKKVVVCGGHRWPTWKELCKIKKKYWEEDETAIQFNVSKKFDLNKKHIVVLWEANGFLLPPKELV